MDESERAVTVGCRGLPVNEAVFNRPLTDQPTGNLQTAESLSPQFTPAEAASKHSLLAVWASDVDG
jgi:hypothetical protein